ncbi:hypothetical protein Y1Q_0022979 [Alligator mississippiensis]|uniref:Uncharacterized protein n=1 Tax=Alligator mississippiensis TaxID=8496 RepID=A0A151P751_ALLMI|nr:hypothetical protein Y1Q_0022979 [Alligator mississippiensis]
MVFWVRCLPDLLLVFPDSACWLSLRVTYCFWSLLYSYLVSVTIQGSSLQCYCGTTSSVISFDSLYYL